MFGGRKGKGEILKLSYSFKNNKNLKWRVTEKEACCLPLPYIHTYTHTHVRTHKDAHTYMHKHTPTHVHTHRHTHTYTNTQTSMCLHTQVVVLIH